MHFTRALLRLSTLGLLVVAAAERGALAQAAGAGEVIALSNASFEDVPRQAHPPRGWYDCGFSGESAVDVHPAHVLAPDTSSFFGVDERAFDGNTFLGMVVRDNETYEAVSQRLVNGPLKAGKCYTFSIYIARASNYQSQSRVSHTEVNYDTPAKLRIWGGLSYCNRGEIIAESAPVKNREWLQYNFRFEPKRDHAFIVLEAYYKTPLLFPYNGNLLLDLAGKIQAVPCDEDVPEVPVDSPIAQAPPAKPRPSPPSKPAPQPSVRPGAKPSTAAATTATASASSPSRIQGLSRAQLRAGSIIRVEKLYFKADSSRINDASLPVLDEIYNFLRSNPDVVIEVGGHTNGKPSTEFCDWLSTERAKAVVEYLTLKGIDRSRLYPKGYGKRNPIATNQTEVGRKRNQRVEIKVLSMG